MMYRTDLQKKGCLPPSGSRTNSFLCLTMSEPNDGYVSADDEDYVVEADPEFGKEEPALGGAGEKRKRAGKKAAPKGFGGGGRVGGR